MDLWDIALSTAIATFSQPLLDVYLSFCELV